MSEAYYFGDFSLSLRSPTAKRNVSLSPLPQPRGQGLQGERCAGAVLHCSPSRSRGKLHTPGREAAPFAAEATPRGLAGRRYSVSSAPRVRRGEAALRRSGRDGTTPPRGASRLATPRLAGHSRGERAASGLSEAMRSLPASSPPGRPQRGGSHRPRPSFTKWRRLFVRRHQAPQLPSAPPETGPRVRSHPALRGEGPHRY